jgi:hypothetical protein
MQNVSLNDFLEISSEYDNGKIFSTLKQHGITEIALQITQSSNWLLMDSRSSTIIWLTKDLSTEDVAFSLNF